MRGLSIAFLIIFCCLGIELWNTVEMRHFEETNMTITGWNPEVNPPIRYVNLPGIGTEDEFQTTLSGMSQPAEQPIWEQAVNTMLATLTFLLKFIELIINLFINTTIGFFAYLRGFGRSGLVIVPDYITYPIASGVYMLYLLMIGQILIGRNMRDGA